ncbi:MAG TPA: single-stranded DNA-binding protein [Puia sp.]|nr:single-stranded DNA-binding protein [Puia sp.]
MKQNNVQLIGYVGSDPVIKVLESGSRKAKIRVATHHKLKNEAAGKRYGTTWHTVIAWDKGAEFAERSFVKGSHILVNGNIIYRTYPDSNNHTRYITEIRANELINLDR